MPTKPTAVRGYSAEAGPEPMNTGRSSAAPGLCPCFLGPRPLPEPRNDNHLPSSGFTAASWVTGASDRHK
jgi:hypothetical protein